jgi:hypothetical protein
MILYGIVAVSLIAPMLFATVQTKAASRMAETLVSPSA